MPSFAPDLLGLQADPPQLRRGPVVTDRIMERGGIGGSGGKGKNRKESE